MRSLRKLMAVSGFILIYGSNCLVQQAVSQTAGLQEKALGGSAVQQENEILPQKHEEEISSIMDIMENESFAMRKVYFDGFQGNIRNCVFESPVCCVDYRIL